MELKPLSLIAARSGSKGGPGKNLKSIGGKPLLVNGINKAIKSRVFRYVVVSTEDNKIATIAKQSGADVPFMRPKKLATDTATTIDVILHVNKKLENLGYKFNVIVNLDITSPFIRTKDIKGALSLLKKKKCDGVFGVYKQHLNPYFNIVEKNSRGFLKVVKKPRIMPKSRQSAPIEYQMSGFHVLQKSSFLRHKTWYMPKILPYEIPIQTGLMIDTN